MNEKTSIVFRIRMNRLGCDYRIKESLIRLFYSPVLSMIDLLLIDYNKCNKDKFNMRLKLIDNLKIKIIIKEYQSRN